MKQLTDKEKEKIIDESLFSTDSKEIQALAQSMTEPIRRVMGSESFMRQILPPRVIYGDDIIVSTDNECKIGNIARKIKIIKDSL